MEQGRIDYRIYLMSKKEKLLCILAGGFIGMAAVLVFYRNPIAFLAAFAAGGYFGPKLYRQRKIDRRRQQLIEEFREALYDLVVGLKAGRSLEGTFEAALKDMDREAQPLLAAEWEMIVYQSRMGFPIEDLITDLGERSGILEIRSFARLIQVCKRTEGDMAGVMESTISMLQDRMEIRAELKVLLSKKKLEQKTMTAMPFVIVALLLVMSPDYLAPLYGSVQGMLIMTVCVILSAASLYLASRMVNIEL